MYTGYDDVKCTGVEQYGAASTGRRFARRFPPSLNAPKPALFGFAKRGIFLRVGLGFHLRWWRRLSASFPRKESAILARQWMPSGLRL
jgi:hypothetical protein